MDVVVGRVGRPQGLRGEVTVEVRTDEPDVRFAVGSVVRAARPGPDADAGARMLRVRDLRWQSGRLVLAFDGTDDRTAAEGLRDLVLSVEVDPDERPQDPEEYYDHQLAGLAVVTVAGEDLGEVAEVLHLPAQDVLVIRRDGVPDVLLPFVGELVPSVDLAARLVTVDPPDGLLDPPDPADPAGATES